MAKLSASLGPLIADTLLIPVFLFKFHGFHSDACSLRIVCLQRIAANGDWATMLMELPAALKPEPFGNFGF